MTQYSSWKTEISDDMSVKGHWVSYRINVKFFTNVSTLYYTIIIIKMVVGIWMFDLTKQAETSTSLRVFAICSRSIRLPTSPVEGYDGTCLTIVCPLPCAIFILKTYGPDSGSESSVFASVTSHPVNIMYCLQSGELYSLSSASLLCVIPGGKSLHFKLIT